MGCIARQKSSLSSAIVLKVKHKGGERLGYSDNREPILIPGDPF
jgi:hypothetical protein